MKLLIAIIVFFVGIFFVFIFIFNKFINKNISSAVQDLDKLSQDYTKKEEEASKKLDEADRSYKETLSKAQDEALKLREGLLEQAKQEKEGIIQKAQKEAEGIIEQAEKTRHLLISEIEKRIDHESLKKAAGLVGQVLPEDITLQAHAGLFSEFLNGALNQLDKVAVPEDLSEAKVVSAYELQEGEQKQLIQALQKKVGEKISVVFEINAELVAGVMVILGSIEIDGSLRLRIAEKARGLVSRAE